MGASAQNLKLSPQAPDHMAHTTTPHGAMGYIPYGQLMVVVNSEVWGSDVPATLGEHNSTGQEQPLVTPSSSTFWFNVLLFPLPGLDVL